METQPESNEPILEYDFMAPENIQPLSDQINKSLRYGHIGALVAARFLDIVDEDIFDKATVNKLDMISRSDNKSPILPELRVLSDFEIGDLVVFKEYEMDRLWAEHTVVSKFQAYNGLGLLQLVSDPRKSADKQVSKIVPVNTVELFEAKTFYEFLNRPKSREREYSKAASYIDLNWRLNPSIEERRIRLIRRKLNLSSPL